MAMAATPFKYWTGSIKFRFQIVASAFHKGRIKVVYDPVYAIGRNYNLNYIEIIDIAEKQDFTIEVGNGRERSLLKSRAPFGPTSTVYGSTPLTYTDLGAGTLSVYVVNELTTPDTSTTHDIQVNVFVSAGDDFEVFVPDKRFQLFDFEPHGGYEPQSGAQVDDSIPAHESSPPVMEGSETLGVPHSNHEDLNKVFIGESIKSFRPLLKRYTLHSCLNATFGTDRRVLFGRRAAFPFFRGHVPGAVHLNSLSEPTNFCNPHLIHWVTMAFQGWRGSMRWKIVPEGFIAQDSLPFIQVERFSSTAKYYNGNSAVDTPTNESNCAAHAVGDPDFDFPITNKPLVGFGGSVLTTGYVNPNLEFEVPFYSSDRFIPGKRLDYTSTTGWEHDVFDYRIFMRGSNETYIDAYVAAGEDFQVYFWTGLPKIYPVSPETPLP
jgi:hypothetical protein